jgi:deoxyguanosine kinase
MGQEARMDRGYPFGPHRYIVIEGPIGVGKTTLVHRLAEHARARLVLEIFEENPFLADFYQDRGKYAFQTELFFLLSRFRQLSPRVLTPDLVVVLDAPLDCLLGRIEKRGRSYEKDFDASYLEDLVLRYRREFQLYDKAPVLVVNSAELDFSRDEEAVKWLVDEIAIHTEGRTVIG